MPRVLGPRVACKQTHGGETIFPLGRRRCLGGPVDRRLPTYMGLCPLSGIMRHVTQPSFLDLSLAARGSAYGERGVDGQAHHGRSPAMGHGCVIALSLATSTFAEWAVRSRQRWRRTAPTMSSEIPCRRMAVAAAWRSTWAPVEGACMPARFMARRTRLEMGPLDGRGPHGACTRRKTCASSLLGRKCSRECQRASPTS